MSEPTNQPQTTRTTSDVRNLSIAIVGSGNVAWHLARAMAENKMQVIQFVSRNLTQAHELATQFPLATATESLDFRSSIADLILLAVPDSSVESVARQMQIPEHTVVAHTSGSLSLELLKNYFNDRAGVFYPLQSFTKGAETDFSKVPLLLEATSRQTFELLYSVASVLSKTVNQISSVQRQKLHLAAVFACNFTNHLLGVSRQLMQEAGLSEALLHPLVRHTVAKALENPPFSVQTGPAARNDQNVLDRHIMMLRSYPKYQEIYDLMSESIIEVTRTAKTRAGINN